MVGILNGKPLAKAASEGNHDRFNCCALTCRWVSFTWVTRFKCELDTLPGVKGSGYAMNPFRLRSTRMLSVCHVPGAYDMLRFSPFILLLLLCTFFLPLRTPYNHV